LLALVGFSHEKLEKNVLISIRLLVITVL